MSPIEWWAMTYAVPGSQGPAHVPMTPLTAIGRLHLPRLEPVVEQVGDAHRHEPGDVGDGADIEAALAPRQAQRVRRGPPAAATRCSAGR